MFLTQRVILKNKNGINHSKFSRDLGSHNCFHSLLKMLILDLGKKSDQSETNNFIEIKVLLKVFKHFQFTFLTAELHALLHELKIVLLISN